MTNKNNITKMPYAQWLEECLRDIQEMPIRGIALMGVTHSCESCAHRSIDREHFSRECVSCTTCTSDRTPSHWKSAADLEE